MPELLYICFHLPSHQYTISVVIASLFTMWNLVIFESGKSVIRCPVRPSVYERRSGSLILSIFHVFCISVHTILFILYSGGEAYHVLYCSLVYNLIAWSWYESQRCSQHNILQNLK